MGYTRDRYATRTRGNKTLQIPVPVSWVQVELGYGYGYGVRYPGVYPCHCLHVLVLLSDQEENTKAGSIQEENAKLGSIHKLWGEQVESPEYSGQLTSTRINSSKSSALPSKTGIADVDVRSDSTSHVESKVQSESRLKTRTKFTARAKLTSRHILLSFAHRIVNHVI